MFWMVTKLRDGIEQDADPVQAPAGRWDAFWWSVIWTCMVVLVAGLVVWWVRWQ